MDDSQLKQFIADQRLAGTPDETIRTQLLDAGWPPERLQTFIPASFSQPIRPDSTKKRSHHRIFVISIIVLLLLGGGIAGLLIAKKPKPQTFANLSQASLNDVTFSSPADWERQTSDDRSTQIYSMLAEENGHGVASLSVTAGYEPIGENFPSLPASLQQTLIEKVRQIAKAENFIEFTPFKDCENPKFTSFQDVTYPDTFMALKSTGTCLLDGHEKTMAAVLVVPRKNGITAGMVVGADKVDFEHNGAKFEEIINSIRAK